MKKSDMKPIATARKIYIGISAGLLFVVLTLLAIATFIDHIPWVSFLSPKLSMICEGQKTTYTVDQTFMVNGTTRKLLDSASSFLSSIEWDQKFNIGKIDIASYFSNEGYEYGGIWLRGPSISISLSQKTKSPKCSKSYEVEILDIRDICAETLKNGICAKKPLQWFDVESYFNNWHNS